MSHAISGEVKLHGSASITQAAGVDVAITAGGNAGLSAKSELKLIAGSQGVLEGASLSVTAHGELVLSGGGSSIKVSAAGVEINGSAVTIAGGTVDVTGGMVKIN